MADLWSVLLGGIIGVGGSGLTQLLLHRERWRDERTLSRSEKFEQLVEAIYDLDVWLDEYRSHMIFGDTLARPSPQAKTETIALVHFPELAVEMSRFTKAVAYHKHEMVSLAQRKRDGDKNFVDGFGEPYEKYMMERDAILDFLRKYGQRTFHETENAPGKLQYFKNLLGFK